MPAGARRAPAPARARERRLLLGLTIAFLGCAGYQAEGVEASFGHLPPGVRVDLETSYYEVRGSTWDEVGRSMERNAPRVDGIPAYGLTRWEIEWRFRMGSDAVGCRMRRVLVELRFDVKLPRWRIPHGTLPTIVEQWHRFERAVERHERQHQLYAVQAAEEIVRTLRDRRASSCSELDRWAREDATRIVDRFRDLNVDYDRRTKNGRTEGVHWP